MLICKCGTHMLVKFDLWSFIYFSPNILITSSLRLLSRMFAFCNLVFGKETLIITKNLFGSHLDFRSFCPEVIVKRSHGEL